MGSEFVRQAVRHGYRPVVVDRLTYAGDLRRLEEVAGKYKFYKADICNKKQIETIFGRERPEVVLNFAAWTHVDRSIVDATSFIETNVKGTQVLLDIARKYKIKKFIHLSTDEVYGEIKKGSFSEESPLQPNNPYAASKAAADLLIKSYVRTYNFPAIIIRPSNNYGPWQYPEKLIPMAILNILKKQRIPLYATGKNIREWLYVEDCIQAILLVVEKGKVGEIYNIGSGEERKNIEVVSQILKILGKPKSLINFVKDRPGHDIRYRLNWRKVNKDLGWEPQVNFSKGIKLTLDWYTRHKDWIFSKEK